MLQHRLTVNLSTLVHERCCIFLVVQMGMKEEEYRRNREEPLLGKIPSRGEWLLRAIPKLCVYFEKRYHFTDTRKRNTDDRSNMSTNIS